MQGDIRERIGQEPDARPDVRLSRYGLALLLLPYVSAVDHAQRTPARQSVPYAPGCARGRPVDVA